jgi:hypothetical protein
MEAALKIVSVKAAGVLVVVETSTIYPSMYLGNWDGADFQLRV